MTWVSTTYEKRSALVGKLCQGASHSCVRGNLIWIISDQELFAYKIQKSEKIWEYKKIDESEFTSNENSCPLSYLKESNAKNSEWREEVAKKSLSNKKIKQSLEDDFKEAENTKRRLIIHVETQTEGDFFLEVETLVPLAGRHSNGKLYRIPIRRIKSWNIK